MGIGEFFKALFGGNPPVAPRQKVDLVAQQKAKRKGRLAASRKRVAVITPSNELRVVLEERLKPDVEEEGYEYEDHPSFEVATGSQVLIADGRPEADAKLHAKYDKVLRVKKSMGKVLDVMCVLGRREDYKKYPRGTYPNLLYFCVKEGDLDHREEDIPLEGLPTIEGPHLHNFADLTEVVVRKIVGV